MNLESHSCFHVKLLDTVPNSKGLEPYKVNQGSISDLLRVIQRGKDLNHYEITPKPGANLTPEQFIKACSGISCGK